MRFNRQWYDALSITLMVCNLQSISLFLFYRNNINTSLRFCNYLLKDISLYQHQQCCSMNWELVANLCSDYKNVMKVPFLLYCIVLKLDELHTLINERNHGELHLNKKKISCLNQRHCPNLFCVNLSHNRIIYYYYNTTFDDSSFGIPMFCYEFRI